MPSLRLTPSLRKTLTLLFADAFAELGFDRSFGEVIISDRPDLAQFSCNGALAAAKSQKKNPRELAQNLVKTVKIPESMATLSIAGPGFINIVLSDALLASKIGEMLGDSRLGCAPVEKAQNVVIDLGGPNVAKPMHVGHLRSPIIGDALVKLFRFRGDHVIGDNHLGDWGSPMGMLIVELRRRKPELPYFDASFGGPFPKESPVTMQDLEEMYPLAAKRFKEDEQEKAEVLRATDELQKGTRPGYRALWQHFVDVTRRELERDFGRLGITFDEWLGESFYEALMPKMIERLDREGFTEISDGAKVIHLSDNRSAVASDEEDGAGEDAATSAGIAGPKNPSGVQAPEKSDGKSDVKPDGKSDEKSGEKSEKKDAGTPPLILVKRGGGYLYHTSDLATVEYRVGHFKADVVLYVVDKRQSLHFQQVFAAARKTGLAGNASLEHLAFGTMNGTDGKPFKTRSGGVLKLKDLMQMVNDEAMKRLRELGVATQYPADEVASIAEKVGIATLKFADLKNNRVSDYVFDLEKFAQFEGFTGPYLLYAAVRIKSILRKAAEAGLKPGALVAPTVGAERKLMLELARLPDVIERAYGAREPHHLCQYGYDLSQTFNQFYAECHIMREEDTARQASWLSLSKLCHDQIVMLLGLLGISVPERM